MMFVQLNRARLEAVNTSGHRIFICRAVTLLFPVTETKHHNSLEEGHLDCKDAKLCQAVQKSRSVGHLCQPEQKENVTPVRPRAPRAWQQLVETLDQGGCMEGSCIAGSRKTLGKPEES